MRRYLLTAFICSLVLSSLLPGGAAAYPTKDIHGIIQWGAGGATDSVARAVTPYVEPELGKKIVLVNKPGGTGAVGTQFVLSRPEDGYTILYGAENPLLYKVLDLADFDYHSGFQPINVLSTSVTVIIAHPDRPWNSLKDLVEDAQKRPGQIKMAATGPGGGPHVVSSMIKSVVDFPVASVVFDGEGPGAVAMMGGHVDFIPANFSAVSEYIKAGKVKVLAVLAKEPVAGLEKYPLVTESYPELAKYLPWGSFFGVWVKKEVPDDVKKTLSAAYQKGAGSEGFQKFISNLGGIPLNLTGEEALNFTRHWQSVTTWIMHDAGATKKSPAEFGIPRP